MNEMIERVARAISRPLANMTGGCFQPDNGRSQRGECADGDCYCARVTRHCARAAVEAMREPTEAMQAAGDIAGGRADQWTGDGLVHHAHKSWPAMIDAACADSAPPV